MHTTQLILRPSLEMFFEMQHKARKEAGSALDEAVLGQLAVHCVLSAIQLNSFVTNEIVHRRFPSWWYNIACSFNTSSIPAQALVH